MNVEFDPNTVKPLGGSGVAVIAEAPAVPVSVSTKDSENILLGEGTDGDVAKLDAVRLMSPLDSISRFCESSFRLLPL